MKKPPLKPFIGRREHINDHMDEPEIEWFIVCDGEEQLSFRTYEEAQRYWAQICGMEHN